MLKSNGIANVMAFISNQIIIDTSTAFQETQLQEITIKYIVLFVYNLHPMSFISAGTKYFQLNLDYALDYRKKVIFFSVYIAVSTPLSLIN